MPSTFFKRTAQKVMMNPKMFSLLILGTQFVTADAHDSYSNESGMELDTALAFSAVILICMVAGCIYNCNRTNEDRDDSISRVSIYL